MASFDDLKGEWSQLKQDSRDWSEEDLQLAAELGKTLLERNKELENCIKIHQCTIDDQAQEIEYMKKQTAALREVNDSRLKIYEQLEVSIQDLERANHRLALENANDKKQIKSQCSTIDTLEARVDELQKKCDELNKRQEALLREQQARNELSGAKASAAPSAQVNLARTAPTRDGSTQNMAVSPRRFSPDMQEAQVQQPATAMASEEDVTKLLQQLQEARSQRAREQRKVAELSEQMEVILQEHAHMEEQLGHWKSKAEDMKNLQDEINTLEEVRQGHLCGRCLRGTDSRTQDELSVMLDQEDDEASLAESFAESLRDVDSTLQETIATNCRIPTAIRERSNFTCLIWKIMTCLWNPPSLLSLFSDKMGYFNCHRIVPKFLHRLIKPFFYPVIALKAILLPRRMLVRLS